MMECKNCKTKDRLIIYVSERAERSSEMVDYWIGKCEALQAELNHINKMTWWGRLFGWPWDKKYTAKMVRRD